MSIEIIHHKKPKLKNPKCICDDILDERLNEYELLKFFNKHSTSTLVIGKPGSGKTTFLNSLFSTEDALRGKYSKIYFFCPQQSRSSMINGAFEECDEGRIYDELNYDNLEEVMEQIKEDCDPSYKTKIKSLIIFDDMGAYLKNKSVFNLFKELMFNRRHLRVSLLFCVQTLYSVPAEIRRMYQNFIVFNMNKKALNELFSETLEITDKDIVQEIKHTVFNDGKYNFLFINTDSGRLFKNFDEIIIE
jgi:hypothetical protein